MTGDQIKVLALKLNMSVSELARRLGESPQNFWPKIKRESFTPEELSQIAEKLGIEYKSYFILKSGEKI